LFITTICTPVGFAHGLVTYGEEYGYVEIKCIFLTQYNHPIFQVSKFTEKNRCKWKEKDSKHVGTTA